MFHMKHFTTNLYEFPNEFIHTNYTILYTLHPYAVCIKKQKFGRMIFICSDRQLPIKAI